MLKAANDPDEEVIPAVPEEPRTKLGDIWVLDEHRIGCGDGRDAEFLRRPIGDGATIDAAFLDLPYNVNQWPCRPPKAGIASLQWRQAR